MNMEELVIADLDYVRLRALARNPALAEVLEQATIVSGEDMPRNVVRMYSRVTYVDESCGERREVELVFPDEADAALGRISVLAPVGVALLGLEAGQTIEWPFPDGRTRRLRVERAEAPAAAPQADPD